MHHPNKKNKYHYFFLLILFLLSTCFLYGCVTSSSSENDDQHKEKIIRAARINMRLGMTYLSRGDIQRAKQKLLLAIDEAPQLPETWYALAYFMETTGDDEEAQTYYLKSIALAPNRGDTQNNYGTYLCRKGEYRVAIAHFMLAVHDPHYLDVAAAYENAGLCAMKIPDNTLAIRYFRKAVMENPNSPTSMRKLILLFQQQNQPVLANYYAIQLKKLTALHNEEMH